MQDLSPEGWKDVARMNASEIEFDWEACNPASSAPVYPERLTMTAVMLDDSTLETIRGALDRSHSHVYRDYLRGGNEMAWATELWAIDRACRVLGIDS